MAKRRRAARLGGQAALQKSSADAGETLCGAGASPAPTKKCGNAREERGSRDYVPHVLILRGEREGESDINAAENVDGLARVFKILRAEGDVGVNFVSGNSLLAPETEDV